MPTTVSPRSSRVSARCEPMKPAAPVMTTRGMGANSQYACLWKKPLTTVSHMIFRSSMSDQFSM